jgi:hypothetical protein
VTASFCLTTTMTDDQIYNVTPEFLTCVYLVEDILDFLDDIKLANLLGEDLTKFLNPSFDPFKTIGKY